MHYAQKVLRGIYVLLFLYFTGEFAACQTMWREQRKESGADAITFRIDTRAISSFSPAADPPQMVEDLFTISIICSSRAHHIFIFTVFSALHTKTKWHLVINWLQLHNPKQVACQISIRLS